MEVTQGMTEQRITWTEYLKHRARTRGGKGGERCQEPLLGLK